jgi:hypothetical protein
MEEILEIVMPKSVSENDMDTILDDVRQIKGVKDADIRIDRGADIGTLMSYVQLASGALGVVSTAIPIIKQIIQSIKSKGVTGAEIKIGEMTIKVDNASATDIERLILASKQK